MSKVGTVPNPDENWPLGHSAIRQLISDGLPRLAYDLIQDRLKELPDDSELSYLAALALARGRNRQMASQAATKLLEHVNVPAPIRADVLSLLGRLAKERCRTAKVDARKSIAQQSATAYEQAFDVNPDPFPAINAATMWRIAGNQTRSESLARDILRQVGDAESSTNYWTLATVAEASLLLGDLEKAREFYLKAVQVAGRNSGDIASMRQQVLLLEPEIREASQLLCELQVGSVVAFSGHLIDRRDRVSSGQTPRFPDSPHLEARIRSQIRSHLVDQNCRIGYSSAACGGDLLFAEEALACHVELHIVLPFALEDFYHTSVDYGDPQMIHWRNRCDAVLAKATEVTYATRERYLGDGHLFRFANQLLQGLAITKACELNTEPTVLAVIAEVTGKSGGTNDFVHSWTKLGYQASLIRLNDQSESPDATGLRATDTSSGSRELKSMLFADVKGFSKLREEQTPAFFLSFLEIVATCLRAAEVSPVFQNTWGDGLFLVFDDPAACADFGITLCEHVGAVDFAAQGLPADISVRIGIHSGPVYRSHDPVLDKENFFGSHVNRTARIEPVTMPGCVYASEQMASLLAVTSLNRFRCEYVGKADLHKSYDTCSLYHVLRASD